MRASTTRTRDATSGTSSPSHSSINDPKTLTSYSYAGGDPINSSDPSGYFLKEIAQAGSALAGIKDAKDFVTAISKGDGEEGGPGDELEAAASPSTAAHFISAGRVATDSRCLVPSLRAWERGVGVAEVAVAHEAQTKWRSRRVCN